MGHLLAWQEVALPCRQGARRQRDERRRSRASTPTGTRAGATSSTPRSTPTWADVPMAELRERFATQPGELRGYLTVVPETRWLKHADAPRVLPPGDDRALRGARAPTWRRSSPRPVAGDAARDPRRDAAAQHGLDARVATAEDGSVTWSRGDQVVRRRVRRRGDGRRSCSIRWSPAPRPGPLTSAPRPVAAAGSTCSPRVVDGHAADRAGAWFLSGSPAADRPGRLTGPGIERPRPKPGSCWREV